MVLRKDQSDIIDIFEKHRRFLITTHIHPDADAIGSSLGLALALKERRKEEVAIVTSDEISKGFNFFPKLSIFQRTLPEWRPDVVVFCDCGGADRVGEQLLKQLPEGVPWVNIDHHISNTHFGGLNLVEAKASSTAEVVFKLLSEAGWKISSESARSLLAGLIADTGSFRYPSTSSDTLLVAAKLVDLGADLSAISEHLFGEQSIGSIRLHAKALQNLVFILGSKIAYAIVMEQMYRDAGASYSDTDGLVERIRDIEGVRVGVLIKWDGEIWRISLRGKGSEPNLSLFAESFGGGGHVTAAAFRWRKNIDELMARLIPALEKLF